MTQHGKGFDWATRITATVGIITIASTLVYAAMGIQKIRDNQSTQANKEEERDRVQAKIVEMLSQQKSVTDFHRIEIQTLDNNQHLMNHVVHAPQVPMPSTDTVKQQSAPGTQSILDHDTEMSKVNPKILANQ